MLGFRKACRRPKGAVPSIEAESLVRLLAASWTEVRITRGPLLSTVKCLPIAVWVPMPPIWTGCLWPFRMIQNVLNVPFSGSLDTLVLLGVEPG